VRNASAGRSKTTGGNPGANLKSISHRCHPILVAIVWELNQETIDLPLGCLQGGTGPECVDWPLENHLKWSENASSARMEKDE